MEITTFEDENAIMEFSGDFRFLSNFYMNAPFVENGVGFQSVEHYFQACKCAHASEANPILNAKTPGEAKRLGRTVKLRPNWESIKLPIMRNAVLLKFSQNTSIKKRLLETGETTLIEGNNWGDDYWGFCFKKRRGQNYLGKTLMEIRKILRDYNLSFFNM